MIGKSRLEEIKWCWENETNDEEAQEWREELTAVEQAIVDQWDYGFFDGLRKMYKDLHRRDCP